MPSSSPDDIRRTSSSGNSSRSSSSIRSASGSSRAANSSIDVSATLSISGLSSLAIGFPHVLLDHAHRDCGARARHRPLSQRVRGNYGSPCVLPADRRPACRGVRVWPASKATAPPSKRGQEEWPGMCTLRFGTGSDDEHRGRRPADAESGRRARGRRERHGHRSRARRHGDQRVRRPGARGGRADQGGHGRDRHRGRAARGRDRAGPAGGYARGADRVVVVEAGEIDP